MAADSGNAYQGGAMRELTGDNWTIRIGDVRETAKTLEENSVQAVITSIPYWQLRDYGYSFQIGLEKTPALFVESIVGVFRDVRRALRADGVLLLNVGDTRKNKVPVCIPSMVRDGLIADGWKFRAEIIWDKPSVMPESVQGWQWVRCRSKLKKSAREIPQDHLPESGRRPGGNREWQNCGGCHKCEKTGGLVLRKSSWRPTNSHEMVYLFSKSDQYFADGDTSKEPTTGGAHSRGHGLNPKSMANDASKDRTNMPRANSSFVANVSGLVEVRNVRSVWRIVSKGFKGAHFATFPLELVRKCLSFAVSKGGCCSQCGLCYAPIVESRRAPTRPGNKTKIERHSGSIVGNRDPLRHTTLYKILGYKPCCECNSPSGRPLVLDPFGGAMRTGRVAINMGCRFIGLEGSEEYAALGVEELARPFDPEETPKQRTKRVKAKRADRKQRTLFPN